MFKEIADLVSGPPLERLKAIASRAPFSSGLSSNPHSRVKNNLQVHDPEAAQLMTQAMAAHEDFRNFVMPVRLATPMLARYEPGMEYGWHADAAFLEVQPSPIRCDISCTIFLSDPDEYEGGALRIRLGTQELSFRGKPGSAVAYPSHSLHRVDAVTGGVRLVGLTFLQSRIGDSLRRETLYELNEVAALEGLKMTFENFSRLQLVRRNLLHMWGDPTG